jgi:hypothetical protein
VCQECQVFFPPASRLAADPRQRPAVCAQLRMTCGNNTSQIPFAIHRHHNPQRLRSEIAHHFPTSFDISGDKRGLVFQILFPFFLISFLHIKTDNTTRRCTSITARYFIGVLFCKQIFRSKNAVFYRASPSCLPSEKFVRLSSSPFFGSYRIPAGKIFGRFSEYPAGVGPIAPYALSIPAQMT